MSRLINRLSGRVYGWFDSKEARPLESPIPSRFRGRAQLALLNLEDRSVPAVINGFAYNDINGNGVFNPTDEAGIPGVGIFLDDNGNGKLDTTVTNYVSTDVPQTIPTSSPDPTNSIINVPDSYLITDVNVTIDISHTWDADMDIYLISPGGTKVALSLANGGSGDNYTNTVFDDEAPTSITTGTAPFTGSFQPQSPLSVLDGSNAKGVWTLQVFDKIAGDGGSINAWSLDIDGKGELSTSTNAFGKYSFTGLGAGTYNVTQIAAPPGFTLTSPASGKHVVTVGASDTVTKNFGYRRPLSTIDGRVFNDIDGNAAIDPGEPGIEGVTVFLDDNGNGKLDTSVTNYVSADVPQTIPTSSPTPTNSTITVPDSYVITDVNVTIDISHTWDADMAIYLISPGGTKVALSLFNGGSGDNYTNTVFDDEAATSITVGTAPFTGTFQPQEPLSKFDGSDAKGVWTLQVFDNIAGDGGSINAWSLDIDGKGELSSKTNAEGRYNFSGLGAGTYNVTQLGAPPGFTVTSPASGKHVVVLGAADFAIRNFGNRRPSATINGNVFVDSDLSTTRDFGEVGIPNAVIFLDDNKNGKLDTAVTNYDSADVPQIIPNSSPNPISIFSTLTIADSFAITDVNVTLDITHTWDEDLDIYLISPGGTKVALSIFNGGSGDNYTNTVFDDEAGISINAGTPPFTGSFQPEEPLSKFDGTDAKGTWKLLIIDTFPGADGGSLNSWSLQIDGKGELSTLSNAQGDYFFAGLPAGKYNVVQIPPAGFAQFFPAGGGPNVVTLGAGDGVGNINFADVPAPTASGTFTNITDANVATSDPYIYEVTFATTVGVISFNSVDDGDETIVTGPGGYSKVGSFVSAVPAADNATITVKYSVPAPAGGWDKVNGTHNGTYTVSVVPNQVFTNVGVSVPGGAVGKFKVGLTANYIVDTNEDTIADDGKTSLREAMILANAKFGTADTITFSKAFFDGTPAKTTITFLTQPPLIEEPVTIVGPGQKNAIITGDGKFRQFNTAPAAVGSKIVMTDLSINGGANTYPNGAGAVYSDGQDITFERVTFSGNKTGFLGAAVWVGGVTNPGKTTVILNDCLFENNSAADSGGALFINPNNKLIINRSTITGNTSGTGTFAGAGGGIFAFNPALMTISNSTFSNNVSNGTNGGGAIAQRVAFDVTPDGAMDISNCTFFGNNASAGNGGAINIFQLTTADTLPVVINNTTITNNSAVNGGGISNNNPLTDITISSSIISGNSGTGALADLNVAAGTATATFSAVGVDPAQGTLDYSSPTNLLFGTDLKLATLADNGGPTQTVALAKDSPALNKGTDNGLLFDQRGAPFVRVVGAAADIGAFELQAAIPSVSKIQVNNAQANTTQRSRILNIDITFGGTVNVADFNSLGQITLTRLFDTPTGGTKGFVVNTGNGLVVSQNGTDGLRLTFTNVINNGVEHISLADGRWELKVNPSSFVSNDANPAQAIRRLYGDFDGNGTTDGTDFGFLGFGSGNIPMDYDNNGTVDGIDFGQFGARSGVTV